MADVSWTELRGIAAVALVVAAIVFAWSAIESRGTNDDATTVSTTSTTTSTTVAPTTTRSQDEKNLLYKNLRSLQENYVRGYWFSDSFKTLQELQIK